MDETITALSLIEKSDTAFIASVDDDGFPNMKAMLAPREHDGLSVFYFTTNTSSMRVSQFRKNPKAALYFYSGRTFQGLMLKGTMEVMTDQPSKDRIWREGDTMYYSKGATDPDYCVLKFTSREGRLYQNFSSVTFPTV